MSKAPLNFFNIDEAFSSGGYFNDGLYRIELPGFTYFDFNKPGNDSLCMCLTLQPVVDGQDTGEPTTQYWPVADKMRDGTKTIEPCTPIKGRKGFWSQIKMTENNTHDKAFGFSDFALFMKQLDKVGKFDMDAAANDITALDQLLAEMGKQVVKQKAKTVIEEAEDTGEGKAAPKKDKEIIVIVDIPATKSKTAKKPAGQDEKSAAKPPKKAAADSGPEDLLQEYLAESICTEDNEGGTPIFTHKLGLSNWLGKTKKSDADTIKEVMQMFNDPKQLGAILTTVGWEISGKVIKKTGE